ncbi:MAG TPA: hypothetical protein DCS93_36925 [Microscillaceae bacterium]|nr:hypothetical protein [Microscillaceae bacterium]
MKTFFYNLPENRLRAGWRILIFAALFWGLSALIFVIKPLFGDLSKREFLHYYRIVIVSVLAIAATLAVILSRKRLDKQSVVSLGLRVDKQAWKDLLFGFALSGMMAVFFLLLLLGLGLAEYQGFRFDQASLVNHKTYGFIKIMSTISVVSLTILFLEDVLVGYWEELVFRGYIFQNMVAGIGLRWAIGISCLLYGLIHVANPNASLLSSSIIMLFGFLRLYGYLSTQMLWLSMGMHIGWNFFQGPVFGFAASGHTQVTLVKLKLLGPNWLTGGAFGPEGSVLIIPMIILALVAMRWWVSKFVL